jgi:uncharacterized LabA/DUF88 family protein
MPEAVEPQNIKPARVMLFIDFWNYELSMKELDPNFLTNWFQLPVTIIREVSKFFDVPVQYERCFIVGSYDPASPGEARLRGWAANVLSKVPGMFVNFTPRQRRTKGPQCTGKEHHEVRNCPVCNASMLGTQEKGVDTHIATEMLTMAFSGSCDSIVLVSADKDFIPAVERLLHRNIKVIHAFFPNHRNELTNKSWASFNLFKVRDKFRRTAITDS